MSTVSRSGRILDLLGALVFVVGAVVFGRAWIGFRTVPSFQPGPDDPPMAALQLADGYLALQRLGGGLMLAGVAVFVVAWWVAGKRDAPPD